MEDFNNYIPRGCSRLGAPIICSFFSTCFTVDLTAEGELATTLFLSYLHIVSAASATLVIAEFLTGVRGVLMRTALSANYPSSTNIWVDLTPVGIVSIDEVCLGELPLTL